MRTDVKLGVVVAMVVVSVAGGYYMYRDRAQQPILIADQSDQSPPVGATKPETAPVKQSKTKPQGTLAQGAERQKAPQRLTHPNQKPANNTRRAPQQNNRQRGNNPPSDAIKRAQQKRAQQQLAMQQRNQATTPTGSQTPAATPKLPPVKTQASPVVAQSNPPVNNTPKAVPLTATAPSTVMAAVEKHRVQPGDTLSSLAVQYYGSERHTRMLIEANKQLANPNRLKIGEIVNLPPAPTNVPASSSARRSTSSGAGTYTVRSGDSFYLIAQNQLGDASRWEELYELNRRVVGNDPASLKVGQVLTLPKK